MLEATSLSRMKMVVRAYQAFFQSLAFKALPRVIRRYLGEAGFADVVEMLAEAAIAAVPHLLEATRGIVEVPEGDVLDKLALHVKCHLAAREITGDESIPMFNFKRLDSNRAVFYAERCPHGTGGDVLNLAVYIGVIVGVLRVLGVKAYGLHSEEMVRHVPRRPGEEVYVVYPSGEGCNIIVEKLGG